MDSLCAPCMRPQNGGYGLCVALILALGSSVTLNEKEEHAWAIFVLWCIGISVIIADMDLKCDGLQAV